MRKIDRLVVHCTATPPHMVIGAAWLRDFAINARGWDDGPYHYIVRRESSVEEGRPVEVKGAHVRYANAGSIGVAWVGGVDKDGNPDASTITDAQWDSLVDLLISLADEYGVPTSRIQGHNEVIEEVGGAPKACPVIDMDELRLDIRAHREGDQPPMRAGEDMVRSNGEAAREMTVSGVVEALKGAAPVVGALGSSFAGLNPWLGGGLVVAGLAGLGIWIAWGRN